MSIKGGFYDLLLLSHRNCLYAASRIAAATGDSICSMSDCLKKNERTASDGGTGLFGIVTPTYFGACLRSQKIFRKMNLTLSPGTYCYLLVEYGSTPVPLAFRQPPYEEEGTCFRRPVQREDAGYLDTHF